MTERVNLVDAYDNRSVVAKLVNIEERISGAESSIEKTVEDGQTSIDTKVSNGVTKINSLLTGLDDTIAKAEAAASTAETASTKAETAAKSVDEDIVAANNAVLDAQGYATTGKLHDGTAVTSASNIAKSCETYADTASKAVTQAQASATAAAASQTAAGQNAASAETSAKDASGYLDTVKASADAAAVSETNAAASATKAQEIADSMNVDNFVDISTAQNISGVKTMTGLNVIQLANWASAKTQAVPAKQIMSTSVGGLNLVHRSSYEPISGIKSFNNVPEIRQGYSYAITGSQPYYGYYQEVDVNSWTEGLWLEYRPWSGSFLVSEIVGIKTRITYEVFTDRGDFTFEFIAKIVVDESTRKVYWEFVSAKLLSCTFALPNKCGISLGIIKNLSSQTIDSTVTASTLPDLMIMIRYDYDDATTIRMSGHHASGVAYFKDATSKTAAGFTIVPFAIMRFEVATYTEDPDVTLSVAGYEEVSE